MFLKQSVKAFVIFSLLLVTGCSSTDNLFPSAGKNAFKIDSIPAGASVYVMDEKMGVTPITISHKDVFPNLYPREKESLYGRVTLKKTGCVDLTKTISTAISIYGLHAKLDCGDSASSSTRRSVPRVSETVEQRLDRIKELQGKGLISADEAKKARERILKDL